MDILLYSLDIRLRASREAKPDIVATVGETSD